MTLKEFWDVTVKLIPFINSILLIVFCIWNFILKFHNIKLKRKIDSLKYWIAAIDKDELIKVSSHDVRYLNEARKILNED